MDHAIYTSMGAAVAALDRQALITNNLANASTTGFKAQLMAQRAVPVTGPTLPTRTMVVESTPGYDNSPGTVTETGRNLDVALPQNGWLAVSLPGGQEGYTRDGSISVDRNGQLLAHGRPLMGEAGPLNVPAQSVISIADDGTVTARSGGAASAAPIPVGRLKMVNVSAGTLERAEDGLFLSSGQPALPGDPALRLTPAALESSNVSPVTAMVDMISTARSYEMHMKVISSVDDNDKNANQLLSIS